MKQQPTHDDLRTRPDRIEALSFVLLAVNDEASVDMSDYTATVAGIIHEDAGEARKLFERLQKVGNA